MSETPAAAINGDAGGAGPMPRMRRKRDPAQAAPEAASEGQRAAPPPGAEAAEEAPRRRRRGRGASADDVAAAARRLVGIHAVVAHMLKAPELMISEAEAAQLMVTGSELAAEFDVEVSGRFAVVVAFIGTAASVYVPRMLIFSQRVAQARQAQEQEARAHANGTGQTINGQVVQ